MPDPSPIIDVQGLTLDPGREPGIADLTFSVPPGEALGLLGRNGMGKTTLIRGMLRLMRATTGRIVVRGRDCSA